MFDISENTRSAAAEDGAAPVTPVCMLLTSGGVCFRISVVLSTLARLLGSSFFKTSSSLRKEKAFK